MSDVILETNGLTREFSGFVAVNNVDLKVREGSICALIGPNGAGKTTCFNLLTKFLQPTRGTIRFKGVDITGHRAGGSRAARDRPQLPDLGGVSRADGARECAHGAAARARQSRSISGARRTCARRYDERARQAAADVGLEAWADTPAALLSYGRKRALEIATTLALDPQLLLLDEPTAGMTHEDIDRIVALIKTVRAGRTVLMVEHNLSVVEGLCDYVIVMTRGSILAQGDYASGLGKSRRHRGLYRHRRCLKCATSTRGTARAMCFTASNFDVHAGEVVTLLGRNGAGKSTTLKSIMGLITQRDGSDPPQRRRTRESRAPIRSRGRASPSVRKSGASIRASTSRRICCCRPFWRRVDSTADNLRDVPEPEGARGKPGLETVRRRAADAGDCTHPAHRRASPAAR